MAIIGMSLQMVQRPEPPYPADVRARGWGFTLEVERLENSDTWGMTEIGMRPWLLMLWMKSWSQTPAGSLPSNDLIIANRIGMDPVLFTAKREILMRGWYLANDDRHYHPVLTELVEVMRDSRAKDRAKKAKQRADVSSKKQPSPPTVPGDSPPCPPTGTGTGTGTGLSLLSTEGSLPTAKPSTMYRPPDCPHLRVLEIWAEVLPEQHQHDPEEWRGARSEHLRARWRESAAKEGAKKTRWASEADGILYFRRLFLWMRQSAFLMGKTPPRKGGRQFTITLEWVVRQANWAKIIEGSYHEPEK